MINKKLSRFFPIAIVRLGISAVIFFCLIPRDVISAFNSDGSEIVKKSFDMIPFYWTIGIVGGCIAITLAYVSWRKYKAEQKKQVKKNTNSN